MAAATEAFRLRHRVVNEVALANAESVPSVHFNRENADQGFNQPWPERNAWRASNTAPSAESSHGVVHRDGWLTHDHAAQRPLTGLTVWLMGMCCQQAADAGDVFRMDEVEARIHPQPTGQPQPTARFSQAFGEIAGGERAAGVDSASEDQSWKDSNDLLGERVLLQIFQALGLGLDVFGAIGQCFG